MRDDETAASSSQDAAVISKTRATGQLYPNSGTKSKLLEAYLHDQLIEANRNTDGTFSCWCAGCNKQTVVISAEGRIVGFDCTCPWTPVDLDDDIASGGGK